MPSPTDNAALLDRILPLSRFLGRLIDGRPDIGAAFVLAGLAVGHLLGGPEADDRTVPALTTSSKAWNWCAWIVTMFDNPCFPA